MADLQNPPTLALRALLGRIERAALDSKIPEGSFRVDYKRNRKDELVVALIIPDGVKGGFNSISIP